MSPRELAPGLHLFTSSAWQMASLVAFLGEEALVVDPGYFPQEVARQAELLAVRPASGLSLLITHGDFDHVAGVAQLPPASAIIGHSKLFRRRPEKVEEQLAAFDRRLYVERPGPFAFPYPTVPIERPAVLEAGDERLHLFPAPGHTPDGLFTLLERRGIFLTGDYLSDLEFPFVCDSVDHYLASLALAAELLDAFRPRVLIPGHGPVALSLTDMRDRLARDRQYLEALSAGVGAAVAEGRSLRETRRRLASLAYRGEPIAPHLAGEHQSNVVVHYRNLRRGVARHALV